MGSPISVVTMGLRPKGR